MRPIILKATAVMAALAVLAGCALSESRQQRQREALTRRIVDDAIAYNEAYSSATSSQILLNILRARDRQPRQYMSMSGFTNAEPDSRGANVSVGGIPLDDLGEQWGVLGFGGSRSTTSEPEYKVEPFASGAYTAIVLQPASRLTFAQYWDSGWSRDLVLLLLVQSIQIEPLARDAPPEVFINHAASIRGNCAQPHYDHANAPGCAFVQAVRALAGEIHRRGSVAVDEGEPGPNGICGLVEAYAPERPVYRVAGRGADACAPKIVVGDTLYTLSLRSLDGMVYYIGELLRDDPRAESGGAAMLTRVNIAPPGIPTGAPSVPIFRILPAEEAGDQVFAARATYAGRDYVAGPAVSRLCDRVDETEACINDVAHGDRSSTVIEFLGGILAFNQSERAVSAPQRQ